jgi:hypothetical protein
VTDGRIARMPIWVRGLGFLSMFAGAALCGRLVWEQTALTWRRGPQMVGFSLAHGYAAPLLLAAPALLLWTGILVVLVVVAVVTRRRVARAVWFDLLVSCGVIGIAFVPYGTWQSVFAGRLARGPYVGEFMTYAAATGDLRTVKALLAQGASVDVTDREGKTGLHGAAVGNKVLVLEYLLSRGASIDAINRFGDSPLAGAVEAKSGDAAAYLARRGGHDIRGTEAQREKAVHDIVSEDIARMDAERKR